jgi:MtN3 and saliva related transmembrane protein
MVLIVITSTIVWLVYGFAIQSGPVILANTIVFVLTLVLLGFKLSFPKNNSKGL